MAGKKIIYSFIKINLSGYLIMEIENEKKSFKISEQKSAALIYFMKAHPNLVNGKFINHFTVTMSKNSWKECKTALNNIWGKKIKSSVGKWVGLYFYL